MGGHKPTRGAVEWYLSFGSKFEARCPRCQHRRALPAELLAKLRLLVLTPAQLAARMRCSKCHHRGCTLANVGLGPDW